MRQNPLVTVVTPSFNQGQYIEETIKSVLKQTYDNIEYIIIDGGSNDNTLNILKKYTGRIKYISEKDNGQANAINKGFKMASGDIIGWINSDDVLNVRCIELVVKEFIKDSKVGLVYGNYVNIDNNGLKMNMVKNSSISLYRLLNIDCGLSQPGSFYKKDYVEKVGFLNESLRYVMDYDLWIKLLKISKIKYLDKILAYFRLHDNSKTVSEIDGFGPEICKILKKNNGSIYALPSKYLKENYYDKWFLKVKPLIVNTFNDCRGKNIGIYGTGTHTKCMLDICNKIYEIDDFNIFMFDSNRNKWNTKIYGYNIFPPQKINDFNIYKLVISSFSYQDEIYDLVKKFIDSSIKIVKLYDREKNSIYFT